MKTKKEIENELRLHFANKQKEAELKTSRIIDFARNNKEFDSNYKRLNELNYLIAKKKYDRIDCSQDEVEYTKLLKAQKKLLSSLKLSDSDLQTKYECTLCNDSGFIENKPCVCYKREFSKRLLIESGINYNALKKIEEFDPSICKPDDLEHKKMLEKLLIFIKTFTSSFPKVKSDLVFLTGNTGTGKTFASEVIVSELIKRCFYVNIITAFQMNNIFLDYHKDYDKSTSNKLSPLLDVDLLVIDDLGTEPIFRNVTKEYLYLIISERLRHHKKTIITTNLTPNEFIDKYGERIYSRVFDKSKSIAINLRGEDLRTDNKFTNK
jgi:DNA replication protein DnaC